ncbi:MAG: S-methyl-5-thioribose-1-phosphate isomerase [Spirillospora sp.]
MTTDVRTIEWVGDGLRLLDQTLLPERVEYVVVRDVGALVDAIRRLVVRGAPALGVAGGFGVALAVRQATYEEWDDADRDAAIDFVRGARPTAVNLAAAVDRVRPFVPGGTDAVLAEAQAILDEDVRGNHAIGAAGADWILDRVGDRPLRVLTHCNAGALATAGRGTALGIVRELHERGRVVLVYANETRPLLQGTRLTAWELGRAGVSCIVQVDGAAPSTIMSGRVDVAVIGADRIAANGDTANKIGSLGVALACADAGIPLVVAAPWSTVDLAVPDGGGIPIEERAPEEVRSWMGVRAALGSMSAFNPAFDVTPARLVTALVTETGVLEVSSGATPATARA